jgi:CRISPR-associated protein Cas2
MKQLWIIAYDISDHQRRKMIHDILKNHGERVQWSVFECYLDEQTLQSLRTELAALIEQDEGSIRWYPLCAWCQREIESQGCGELNDDPEFYLV